MLNEYERKRRLEQTPEPPAVKKTGGTGPLTFVIQKHSARQLHYDFRLELDGVLKSWAVAKGPSTDPSVKRLAVMVEDHPPDYGSFEGIIPVGQYGAGQVIVWDHGTYSPDEGSQLSFNNREQAEERMRQGLLSGKISVTLRGDKLKGSWTLVKMQRSEKNWLLIKHHDEHVSQEDILGNGSSVMSGLTIDDLKAGHLPTSGKRKAILPADAEGAVKSAFPVKISPMLASLSGSPFSDKTWLFEPKLDGYRTMAYINNGKARLLSRNGIVVTEHYPSLAESLKKQPVTQAVLDGEIIALDSKGKLCFQCLQGYLKAMNRFQAGKAEEPSSIIFYVFDILYLDGYNLIRVPLNLRKEMLTGVLISNDDIRLVEYFSGNGETVYKAAVENGLEGVIAKKEEGLYEPGRRSQNWLKIKAVASDEFVVAGFTEGTGNRVDTFGALVLGYHDDQNHLQPAGNVGTGFDTDMLVNLRKRLNRLITNKIPFHNEPELTTGLTWVKPEIVVEVKFAEWTNDNRLRAPVFLRVRDDKPASSVHATKPLAPPSLTQTVLPTGSAKARKEVLPPRSKIISEVETGMLKEILVQMAGSKSDFILEIERNKVSLSNLDKAIWPEFAGNRAKTKRDLITYLAKVSPLLLPHLKDRPLTLSRYPNGIHGQHFFQKHFAPVPDFVETVTLSAHDMPDQDYLICNNLSTLVWLGQIADLELHTWFSRVKPGPDFKAKNKQAEDADYYANFPDFLIFDLDPYIYSGKEKAGDEPELNKAAFTKACELARKLKETLDSLGFPAFVKTSGRTGLHVFVPILRDLDFHGSHSASETLSRFLQQQYPSQITTDWAVEKRAGKIFMDYNQNVRGKTLASIYSPRPSPEGSVSIPLRWDELGKIYPTDFTILTAPERLDKVGDLWANIFDAKIDLVNLVSAIKPGK